VKYIQYDKYRLSKQHRDSRLLQMRLSGWHNELAYIFARAFFISAATFSLLSTRTYYSADRCEPRRAWLLFWHYEDYFRECGKTSLFLQIRLNILISAASKSSRRGVICTLSRGTSQPRQTLRINLVCTFSKLSKCLRRWGCQTSTQ